MAPLTKERLLTAGQKLFTQHGIGQVGLDRVLAQAGLTKTTFYNHFSSKEDLIREAVARDEEQLVARLEEGIRMIGGGAPGAELLAVYDVTARLYSEGWRAGALLLNALLEFPTANDPTRGATIHSKQSLGAMLRSRVQRLGVAQPERLANQLQLIFDGTLINYQFTRDQDSFREGQWLTELALKASPAAGNA